MCWFKKNKKENKEDFSHLCPYKIEPVSETKSKEEITKQHNSECSLFQQWR